MKFLLLSSLLILLNWSCKDKTQLPKDILPKPKMREVMWDIVRAEEFLNSFVVYRDTGIDKAAESQKWYEKVYRIHKISRSDFEKSYAYYKDHDLLKEVFDSLAKRPAPAQPGEGGNPAKDSLKAVDTVSIFNKSILLDTLKRKRILKKMTNPG